MRHTGGRGRKPDKWSEAIKKILNNYGKSTHVKTIQQVKEQWTEHIIKSVREEEIPVFFNTLTNRAKTLLDEGIN